jgi:hypothetical protein
MDPVEQDESANEREGEKNLKRKPWCLVIEGLVHSEVC